MGVLYKATGKPAGKAFVEFEDKRAAGQACAASDRAERGEARGLRILVRASPQAPRALMGVAPCVCVCVCVCVRARAHAPGMCLNIRMQA